MSKETEALKKIAAHNILKRAAPDLLAALEQIMAEVAGCQKEPKYEAARAAIAKAKGNKS
jgi:hypothetical protein